MMADDRGGREGRAEGSGLIAGATRRVWRSRSDREDRSESDDKKGRDEA